MYDCLLYVASQWVLAKIKFNVSELKKKVLFFFKKFKQSKNLISKNAILIHKNASLIWLADLNI